MSAAARRLLLLVSLLLSVQAWAATEVWLVTYGPGQESWERFGHNALWLRDAELGLDHVYSFGYFDMDDPEFLLNFIRGDLRYYGNVALPEEEFAFYRGRERSVRMQHLALTPVQAHRLHKLLHENILPAPRYYAYDYFFANCSTWLRDLLDETLDGQIHAQLEGQAARLNFRDHIRRLNQNRLELHAGLLLLLGPTIDEPRTAWEEGFLPGALADWLNTVEVGGQPLVLADELLYSSPYHREARQPVSQWWSYGLIALLAALVVLPGRRRRGFWALLPWRSAVVLTTAAGSLVLLMWAFTRHEAIAGNAIVLLLNPAWLLMLFPLPELVRRLLWWLLLAGSLAGSVLLLMPAGPQFRPQLVCGLLPLLAAMLIVARSQAHRPLARRPRPQA